jgi:hypothetical protein
MMALLPILAMPLLSFSRYLFCSVGVNGMGGKWMPPPLAC